MSDDPATPASNLPATTTQPGLRDVKLHLIETLDDVGDFLRWLGERRPKHAIAYDTETTGLDTQRDRVRLLQFGDGIHGWAMDRDEWLGVARDVLRRWDGEILGHNLKFDGLMSKNSCNMELPVERCHDTMVQSRVREPHMSMALKNQCARHVDPAAAGLQYQLQCGTWTWETVPTNYVNYWTYGALDTVLTYRLDDVHRPQVLTEAPRAYELEMAVTWVAGRMQQYGAHVDRQLAMNTLVRYEQYCRDVETWCRDVWHVGAGSNAEVIKILESEGYTFTKATKSGAKSLDAEVLGGIDHPLAEAVLKRRQVQKMASTYLRFYVDHADANDLVHPSINTLAALTSRMTMDTPNLQNLPRHGTSRPGQVVRRCVSSRWVDPSIPDEQYHPVKHGGLILVDFDQIEMRELAHFANEPLMIAAFHSPEDFFVNLARQLYADDTIVKSDPRRQVTKNAGYATIYGAGVAKFAATAGVTTREAQTFRTRWNAMYPAVVQFQGAIQRVASERYDAEGLAYVRSPFTGRRFVASDPRKAYALVNYLIQGCAAELLKLKILECDAAGIARWLVVPVHDELMFDVPAEHVLDVVNTLTRIMNDSSVLRVPVTASVSYGRNWGDKREWSDRELEVT